LVPVIELTMIVAEADFDTSARLVAFTVYVPGAVGAV
jgi:hypothetical protein